MWRQPSHHHRWKVVRSMAGRPGLDFYELRHCAATMLLERGMTPWDVAIPLGHQDGGRLVTSLYGHPSEVAARERLLACWDEAPIESNPICLEPSGSRRRALPRHAQGDGMPSCRQMARTVPGAISL
jgi:hypothetical protein